MGKIEVAIIGTGYWGINYIRTFNELPQSRVAVACDQNPERLEEMARRYPGVETTTEVGEILRRESIRAVIICTPASTHYEIARRCLEAHKHLLVEKPITTSAEDAEELIALASSMEVTLMVGHTFIHNPGIRKVKAYLDQGSVGHPYYMYARRTNMGPIRRDVNALWDLAPHDVSVFNYLLGSVPERVSAVGARVLGSLREDVGFITLGYPEGVLGHVHVSWADPNKVREIVVVGSDRRIVFDDLNPLERVRVFEKGVRPIGAEASSYGEHQFQMRDGDIISPKVEVSEPLKNQCIHFLECLREGVRPVAAGKEGLDVVRVMEAIDRSVELNGAPVSVATTTASEPRMDGKLPPEVVRSMWGRVTQSAETEAAVAHSNGEDK